MQQCPSLLPVGHLTWWCLSLFPECTAHTGQTLGFLPTHPSTPSLDLEPPFLPLLLAPLALSCAWPSARTFPPAVLVTSSSLLCGHCVFVVQ